MITDPRTASDRASYAGRVTENMYQGRVPDRSLISVSKMTARDTVNASIPYAACPSPAPYFFTDVSSAVTGMITEDMMSIEISNAFIGSSGAIIHHGGQFASCSYPEKAVRRLHGVKNMIQYVSEEML